MFLLNDNDQQQQQQQHRPDSHESRETKSVDEAMHGMNIETAPSSSSDVSTIATTTTATSTITTATVTATATATEKVVPITLVEDKSTSNAIDNAVSATTTNATDNYYVDTVGDNRHSTDGTTRSTSATTTPVKQTQRSNYSSSTLYNPDEDSDDIADLPVWEPTSKRRKKKKDKRKHAFARRGQLDDLVAATDGDAVGMDILPSGNAPFSLTSNPSSSRLDGGIAVASTSSGGNPANMAAAAGRVPMVGMRPTVEYNDINERDVQSGKYRRPMGGGPRGAGMGRGSGGIGASGSGTNKPAINMQNPRLSAGRGDATSHGAGSFASNRFPSSSSSSTSNSITPPNFFGLSSSNATTSATTQLLPQLLVVMQ
ncbi:hypothetical protein BDF22DRAFT_466685 [Syncephalis plumigaleata]|nr:hypothetical protein BDF22DRAFT_466685 [Syncephalis plumigaleata]